ncbi:MAG: N-acetylglucosamine-6-phosphate deacetylase [Cyanobacterium sp. T60_A2020_053]|nr:N-acetylglucosamine-6-phosphate deacetylase [Cyanobacterium sp. T60_A2020_053]
MKNCCLINTKLPFVNDLKTIIIDENQHIIDITDHQDLSDQNVIDLQGDYLSLGGVDLQINGGLGLAFPDLDQRSLSKLTEICQYLWSVGVDEFLPAIVTTSLDKIRQSINIIREFQEQKQPNKSARIRGIHLEGPCLNPAKKGAHPAPFLLPLNLENIKKIIGENEDLIKIITLAPELDPQGEVIPYLVKKGIIVSLGHSLATAEEAKRAFEKGATMVTHAFNAMPSLHHREPGLLGEAVTREGVYCGLIADGQHVAPTMLKLVLQASRYGQGIFVVSDALAPMGLTDGVYPWDERQITVKNGTATLPDGTLSGTTLPLLQGAQNLFDWGICTVDQAIDLVTDAPRRALGLATFQVGNGGGFVRWSVKNNQLTWQRMDN